MAVQDVTNLDDEEKKHAEEIAKNISSATGDLVSINQLVPAFNQHPLPQFAQTQPQDDSDDSQDNQEKPQVEPEVIDVLRGWQGKPRTAPAKDFLASKMKWLSKKNKGAEVTLK
jgi:hypothetical protein